MSLKQYHQKRDFRRTTEPAGEKKKSRSRGKSLAFVIQKHAASRLHYDFRLELNGVLKSWSVPKGPSLNSADKRLAVHVEDHPYEYRRFEGTIPAGEYGGGTVMLWDRGTWEPVGASKPDPARAYQAGKLQFRLHGKKLQGEWHLFRMSGQAGGDGKNWLLVKSRDAQASETRDILKSDQSVATGRSLEEIAGLPDFIPPQLATLTQEVPGDGNWIHEVKFDGYRAIARIEGGRRAKILTRSGQDWTRRFPTIARALTTLPVENALLDGEIVKLLPNGLSSFQALQNALSAGEGEGLHYYLFDLLYLDGRDFRDEPLSARREALGRVLKKNREGVLRFSEGIQESHSRVFREACRQGLEGVISKRCDRPYQSGRTRDWLKTKCHKEQEFVIVGFTDPKRGRRGFGALLLAVRAPEGGLKYAGMVGTGFTQKSLLDLHQRFKPFETKEPPLRLPAGARGRGIHWVEPRWVAEVEFTEWTEDQIVRHPSFKGLREDKPAREVAREEPVPRGAADSIEGVRLTHPDKVLYPEQGITKRDLALYYAGVAEHILPYLKKRPISLVRCPEGSRQKCFFQKHVFEGTPSAIDGAMIEEGGKRGKYVVVNDRKGLITLAQLGVLEIHPWGARADSIERPDLMTFDLDPAPEVPWTRVIQAARSLKAVLDELGLVSFLKTTGGKGLHVVVPLERRAGWAEVKAFSRDVARVVASRDEGRFTLEPGKAKRKGKIFLDYLRNSRGATAIAPYSPRARPGAPVATPLSWEELGVTPDHFHIQNVLGRIKRRKKDPWADFFSVRQGLKGSKRLREAA